MHTDTLSSPTGYSKPTGLSLDDIHPRLGSKFSPNLHEYLKNESSFMQRCARVFKQDDGTLWLGFMDDTGSLIGQRMSHVLCYGKKAQTFSYMRLEGLVEVADFWARYRQQGRCAIDEQHKQYFVGDESRWNVSADGLTRECLWCGKVRQRLVRQEITTTVERWQSA